MAAPPSAPGGTGHTMARSGCAGGRKYPGHGRDLCLQPAADEFDWSDSGADLFPRSLECVQDRAERGSAGIWLGRIKPRRCARHGKLYRPRQRLAHACEADMFAHAVPPNADRGSRLRSWQCCAHCAYQGGGRRDRPMKSEPGDLKRDTAAGRGGPERKHPGVGWASPPWRRGAESGLAACLYGNTRRSRRLSRTPSSEAVESIRSGKP